MDLEERTDVHSRAFVFAAAGGIVAAYLMRTPRPDFVRENAIILTGCLAVAYFTAISNRGTPFTALAAGAGYLAAVKHVLH